MTLFPTEPIDRDTHEQWVSSIAPTEPEEVHEQRPQRTAIWHRQATKALPPSLLELRTEPNRADLRLVAGPNHYPFALAQLGPLDSALAEIAHLGRRFLEESIRLNRIALGGTVILPVESRSAGYEVVREFVRIDHLDPRGDSDLVFRLNRPTVSKVLSGQVINRVSTWTVVTMSAAAVGLGSDLVATQEPLGEFARFEFDVNTRPSDQPVFNSRDAVHLLDEFVETAVSLGKEGLPS